MSIVKRDGAMWMRREGAMLMGLMRREEAMWRSILTKRGGNIGEYYEEK